MYITSSVNIHVFKFKNIYSLAIFTSHFSTLKFKKGFFEIYVLKNICLKSFKNIYSLAQLNHIHKHAQRS